jgi:hypothetical protein
MVDCKNARSGKFQIKHLSLDPRGSRPDGGCGVCHVRLMFLCAHTSWEWDHGAETCRSLIFVADCIILSAFFGWHIDLNKKIFHIQHWRNVQYNSDGLCPRRSANWSFMWATFLSVSFTSVADFAIFLILRRFHIPGHFCNLCIH